MGKGHLGIGHQRGHMACDLIDIADSVVYIIYLTAPGQLPVDGLPDHLVIVLHHIRLDGYTLHGRLL